MHSSTLLSSEVARYPSSRHSGGRLTYQLTNSITIPHQYKWDINLAKLSVESRLKRLELSRD